MRLVLSLTCLALFSPSLRPGAQAQQLHLTNPVDIDRAGEVVEIPLKQVTARLNLPAAKIKYLVAENSATKQRVPTQLYSSQIGADPDTLLLLVKIPAHGAIDVSVRLDPAVPAQEALVYGREAPERKDDFAWENQMVTYRVYGPALQATGEITSGIDLWSKRVPNLVIDGFYKRDLEGARTHNPLLSYHKDNGQGLDSYYVGPSRGCGGTAVWANGKLHLSKNYTTLKILGNGPIRFAFEVSYAPWDAGGTTVTETKTITLDADTHLNKIVSTYKFAGGLPLTLAAGLAVHEPAEVMFPAAGSIASVWDTPQDPTAGKIATGLVALHDQHGKTTNADHHALILFERRSGEAFTYFAGSGWSKADMPTQNDWNEYLKSFLTLREHPIIVTWTIH